MSIKRRDFLKLAGLLSAASMFPSLSPRAAGGEPTIPKRLLFVYGWGGWAPWAMRMRPPWAPPEWSAFNCDDPANRSTPDPLEWEFDLTDSRLQSSDFPTIFEPFYRHRRKMLALEDLTYYEPLWSHFGGPTQPINGHFGGPLAAMTGGRFETSIPGDISRSAPTSASIPMLVHRHLLASTPTLSFLQFLPEPTRFSDLGFPWLYDMDKAGQVSPVPGDANPDLVFNRLFSNISDSGPDKHELVKREALTFAKERFSSTIGRVNSRDKAKLVAHMELIQQLYLRASYVPTCAKPASPSSVQGLDGLASWESDWKSFAQLTATAFACDSARVAALRLARYPSTAFGVPLTVDTHQEVQHASGPSILMWPWNETLKKAVFRPSDADLLAISRMEADVRYRCQKVAELLDVLDSIPEGGGTLLDNTLVVHVSEFAHGNHGGNRIMMQLFGGGNGFRMGRYIKYATDNPFPYDYEGAGRVFTGAPTCRVLIAIAQAFGVPLDSLYKSSITNLDGGTLNLSGPLHRLA